MRNIHKRYLLKMHFKFFLGVFFAVALIIFILTFVETLRRTSGWARIPLGFVTSTSLYRLPQVLILLFPYMYLISISLTLESLASSQQLTILRTNGYSPWQILSPFLYFSFFLSLFWLFGLQPLSSHLYEEIQNRECQYFGDSQPVPRDNLWLYQHPENAPGVLLQVGHMEDRVCSDVSVYLFSSEGELTEKFFAKSLRFVPGRWILSEGKMMREKELVYRPFVEQELENSLDEDRILTSLQPPENLGLYTLFSVMKVRQRNRFYGENHTLAIHSLGARAFLIIVMVLLAGCFRSQHVRFGKSASVAQSLFSSLILYSSIDIFASMWRRGALSPFWAGWTPALLVGVFSLIRL
ncbi:MAG: LptF/LptG family permease, partial [Holosporales bacterium]|nr:LptF/LptG family permease [Holosporales bacterium]